MAGSLDSAARELLAQPGFAAALGLIEARLAERAGGQPAAQPAKPAMQVTSQEELVAQVAAEIKEQQRQRQEAVEAYNTAADGIISLLEQSGGQLEAVPPPLLPAVTALLRFYHADAADAGPAPQLSREVQVLLDPASRAAVAAYLTDLHQRAAAKQGPFIAALPPEALGEGVTPDMLPGGRTCRLLATADGSLVAGLAAAPAADVPGLPAGPLNLQTLAFGLAVAERQVPGLHPLSLLMLDAPGQRFVACTVCGHVPCLEHAHVRLVSRQLADSIAQRLAELDKEEGAVAAAAGSGKPAP
ncbi:hypothetical protein COHA_002782 [Chlorella ohadii]|uniref:Uncharacterized protein n=1 Tax=Chlorella ohadii TaxID=2649997 RepID=A0AAD5DWT2_9CHLO|nr:hypothetical protein COHA_002782 [Chlorella ohadii]